MNKEYTYIDGKAIIRDENDKITQCDYYDNLNAVLVQENLIETMEKKIEKLTNESMSLKKYNRKGYIPIILPMTAFISTLGTILYTNWLTGSFASLAEIFDPTSLGMKLCIPLSAILLPIAFIVEVVIYNIYKRAVKRENGINTELNFLKKQLQKEREYLESLKQEKTRDKENTEIRTVVVDYSQQLEILNYWLNYYFRLGFDGEESLGEGNSSLIRRKKNTQK